MSPRSSAAYPHPDDSAPGFKINRGGDGFSANWKAGGLIIAAAFVIGGVYVELQNHGKSIEKLTAAEAVDHDILMRLDSAITGRPHHGDMAP